MPAAKKVCPRKWERIEILFDDDDYSVICGEYDHDFAMGERWNGKNGNLGFPNAAGYPIWHVTPPFQRMAVLHAILDQLDPKKEKSKVDATLKCLRRFLTS